MQSPITLPTVHLNGTGRKMLTESYDAAADKLEDFIDAWGGIEFNARDYYVQGPDAFTAARNAREEMAARIRDIKQYIHTHREHLHQ